VHVENRYTEDTRKEYMRWKAENEVKEEFHLEHQKSNVTF